MGYPSNVRAGRRESVSGCDRIAAADFRPNWHVDRRADGGGGRAGPRRDHHQVRNVDDRLGGLDNRLRSVDDDQVYAASAELVEIRPQIYHVYARRECLRTRALARRAHARPFDGLLSA
jgi:hypothetical protein